MPPAGIDQAALSEEQQQAARQLKDQQTHSPNVQTEGVDEQSSNQLNTQAQAAQQLTQADAFEQDNTIEGDSASPSAQLESPSDRTSRTDDLSMPADAPHPTVLEQPVSELAAADPAEPPEQPQSATPDLQPQAAVRPNLSSLSHLSADERVEIFLQAIRDRSWEQTGRHAVPKVEDESLPLPPSGYTELGAVSPRLQGQMLNSSRSFFPGQRYEPEVYKSLLHQAETCRA